MAEKFRFYQTDDNQDRTKKLNILAGLTADAQGPAGQDGLMTSVQAGTNISVDNTDQANPIVSSQTDQTVTDHMANTANPHGTTKTHVGLSEVDNTSDATKNSATTTLTNKTIISPLGLVKSDVGLSNVDNTSDVNKPVSTAQQIALDLKADSTYVNEKYSGFKNHIINGGFDIWQRGISFSGIGSTFTYTADRWGAYGGIGSVGVSKVAVGTRYMAKLTVTTPDTGSNLQQRIEDVRKLSGKTVTLSFDSYGYTAGKSFDIEFKQSFGATGDTPVNTFIGTASPVNGAVTRHSFTATIPSVSGKIISGGGDNLAIRLLIGESIGDVAIGNLQIEEGSVSTTFEQRPIGLELSLCKRYYWKLDLAIYAYQASSSSILRRVNVFYPVEMRITPTVSNLVSTLGTVSAPSSDRIRSKIAIEVGDTAANADLVSGNFDAEL